MGIKRRVFVLAVVLAGLMATQAVYAGTVGKINGVVLDKTGVPLPGANVVVDGTNRGTTTDADGYYLILSMDPGAYTLTATMVGYTRVTKSDVQVRIDQTTKVDFRLEETVIEVAEMVVVAERPPVEPDKTTSKYTVTADDIQQMTIVRSTSELVALQPGVSQDGLFRIRGGDVGTGNEEYQYRPTDVAFVVDGVRVVSNDGRLNPMFAGVNRGIVQEISVVTGVTPAEYGNAQAGIVNIVTRDGGQRYQGWMEYRNIPAGKKHWGSNVYDDPIHRDNVKWGDPVWEQETDPVTGRVIHTRTDYTGVVGHEIESNVSGPLSRSASFIVSAQHSRQASPVPGPEKYGFYRGANQFIPAPGNFQGSAALTWQASQDVKLKAGMMWQGYKSWYAGGGSSGDVFGFGASANAGGVRGMGDNGRNLFLPEKYSSAGQHKFRETLEYVVLTHTITPKTFYEVRFSHSSSVQDSLNAATENTTLRRDADSRYNLGASLVSWEIFDRQRFSLKADLSSQVSKGHFVKAGGELTSYRSWWTERQDTSPGDTQIQFFGGDLKMGEPVAPLQGALYVQDKMEFEGLVINAGLRLDYFNPRTSWPVETSLFDRSDTRYYTTRDNIPLDQVDAQVNLSPRLGISHPITDRAAMHFSSGMFLQYPGFDAYYIQSYYSNLQAHSLDLNQNGQIDQPEEWNNMVTRRNWWGDPRVRPEKSLAFEVGGDWNFVRDYTLAITTFYRAEWDQLGAPLTSWQDPKQGGSANSVRSNNRAEDVRGLEFSVRKAFSHNFGFQVAYNIQWSDITHVAGRGSTSRRIFPDSLYIASGNWTWDWTVDPTTGARTPKPLTEAEVIQYGKRANDLVRQYINWIEVRQPLGAGALAGYWDVGFRMEGAEGEKGLYYFGASQMRGIHTWGEKPAERRNSGKVQITVNTPRYSSSGPLGWVLSDININALYWVQNGVTYTYTPPTGGAQQWRSGPLESRIDLEGQKTIAVGKKLNISLFMTVLNLLDDQNISRIDSSVDWVQWGLEMARPDNPELLSYGDLNDLSRFTGKPRHVELGFRLRF